MAKTFADKILTWFDRHGRHHLPWQEGITPYRVWISEIMLQQTQVATVIPYFQRFMASFPDVETLAAAPLDEVLHHWSGLGYYTRAKNLHRAAQQVVNDFGGQFPADVETLSSLPGIGRSTAGAIIAIAHKKRAVILDGNVKRVLARHEAIEGWPGKTAVQEQLWDVAEAYTPAKRTNAYTQAMMDLGATLCTRSKPRCGDCPVQSTCQAHRQGRETAYPGKKPKKELPVKSTRMLVISHGEELLLQQRPLTGIWPGLWGFVEIPLAADIDQACRQLGLARFQRADLGGFRHTFSHYHLEISIEHIRVAKKPAAVMEDRQSLWYNTQQPAAVGLAAPVTRIIDRLKNLNLLEKANK